MFLLFDITYFAFQFLAPDITTTDGISNVNIIWHLYILVVKMCSSFLILRILLFNF